MRRRWVVLLVGRARLALGHRSELSRHRTLEGARVAALDAVARLREGPTAGARDYVVVIERDGEGIAIEEMAIGDAEPGAVAPVPAAGGAESAGVAPASAPDAEVDVENEDAEVDAETRDAEGAAPAEDVAMARQDPAPPSETAPAEAVEETPPAPGPPPAHVVVPARYVPSEVARGLHDPAGRALPGSERIPEELIRDWERKIARLEGRPPPGEEPGGEAGREG